MEWMTWILLATILVLLIRLCRRPKGFPPGPFSLPVVGSLPALIMSKEPTRHGILTALARKHGPVMGIYLGSMPAVVISGYPNVKNVLSREDTAFRPLPITVNAESFGRRVGVFFTDGPIWREQRRFILRHLRDFGYGRRSMESLIHEEARAMMELVERSVSDDEFNLVSLLPVMVINVLWTIMTGTRHELDDPDIRKLTRSVLAFFRTGNIFSSVGSSRVLKKIPYINSGFNAMKAISLDIRNYIESTVIEHEATFDENHLRDFMDAYIKEMRENPDSSFCRDELVANCMDLFSAGTETTSSTLAYALRYMVQYPSVQDEMRQELHRVVGTERFPGMDDIPKLPYTQAVVSETLRHSGLVPFAAPHVNRTEVEIMGYRIPKETFIMTNIWSVHMDPEIWGDPENFRPERFIDTKDGSYKKNEHFMPFGLGPRLCIGEPLARFSTLLFLAAFVQRFRFEPRGSPPSDEQLPGITTSPAPFLMTITRC